MYKSVNGKNGYSGKSQKSEVGVNTVIGAVKTDMKNTALAKIAEALKNRSAEIIAANQKDLRLAEKNKLASPLLKRLKFDEGKIADVCAGIESLIKLDDPVGKTLIGHRTG